MTISAEQKFIRTSPRKLRLVVSAVKGLPLQQAVSSLELMTKRAALPVRKVILQALANATNNMKLEPSTLAIRHIEINEGPTYKRWRAVSRGRAHSIMKRTSHIKVTLETVAPKLVTQKAAPVVVKNATTTTETTKKVTTTKPAVKKAVAKSVRKSKEK